MLEILIMQVSIIVYFRSLGKIVLVSKKKKNKKTEEKRVLEVTRMEVRMAGFNNGIWHTGSHFSFPFLVCTVGAGSRQEEGTDDPCN